MTSFELHTALVRDLLLTSSSYHAIVLRKPSRSGVFARHPNSANARDVSRQRLGCPSGLDASQRTAPSYPATELMSSSKSRTLISSPDPKFTSSGFSYFSAAVTIASAASSTYKNSRVALPVPHAVISAALAFFASQHFRISAGITWELSRSKLSRGPYKLTGVR